ncbi:AraC-like DNA-binding protein [Dyella sp. SG562]|uniref:helix-turn-helix domain-containing protein n=1 Tax=Dyella TaxID=231454 RepID=UPI0014246A4B|nr:MULTISPECIES: AraC family transcriptional regulator [unclassified Dyella]NII74140.1 AraC-like DNA-binding protein [Dyella sp. SG562]NKJ20190.1 AraC-like DNA-binding protein [Dyella sp. SG609]
MSPMPPDRLVVPAAHTFTLRRLLVAHGGPVTHAFDELDRPLAQAGSEGSVALRLDDQWCTRVESLGVPELGHLAGRACRVAEHGVLGFALLSCPTLGEALKLWARFAPTLAGGFELRQAVVPGGVEFTVRDLYPLLPGRSFALDRFVGFTLGLCEQLAGLPPQAMALYLPARALSRAVAATRHHPMPALAGDPGQVRLIVSSASLAAPIASAHAGVLDVLLQQCEQEHARVRRPGDWAGRVEHLLERRLDLSFPIEAAAKALCVSTRTLKRRLQEEGWSYRTLVDEVRKREALRAMSNPSLRLEDIASLVGYTDQANFARAFRRWTGKAPGSYRAEQVSKVTPLRQVFRAAA